MSKEEILAIILKKYPRQRDVSKSDVFGDKPKKQTLLCQSKPRCNNAQSCYVFSEIFENEKTIILSFFTSWYNKLEQVEYDYDIKTSVIFEVKKIDDLGKIFDLITE